MRVHHVWRGSGDMDLLTDHRTREHMPLVHVFTDAELRARDERMVRIARRHTGWCVDHIIAAAEADHGDVQ